MQEESWELSVCPSFNSYSSDKLVDVAAKVTREFDHDDEEAFEFVSVRKAEDDVVVLDGQIGPVFPVFNRDLLSDQNPTKSQQITDGQDLKNREEEEEEEEDEDVRCLRIPLKKLFNEEHDPTSYSSSSSEVDELEGVPPGTYCVWTPHSNSSPKAIASAASPSQCKKSNSTGTTTSSNAKSSSSSSSSKRWRLMNLLRRSNSEGKDSFVFLTPKNKEEEISNSNNSFEEENSKEMKKVAVVKKKKKEKEQTMSSAHEVFYGRKRESMERDKRKTYLPYRKDLVGFWASVGSLGRTFPPF